MNEEVKKPEGTKDLQETKGALKSKSIWGILLMILASYFPELGIIEDSSRIQDILVLLGGGLAGYGRVSASSKIKGMI